jgi:hypothetical protein
MCTPHGYWDSDLYIQNEAAVEEKKMTLARASKVDLDPEGMTCGER